MKLLQSTGDATADRVLRGVVGAFELAFPDRVRGYYLKGSFAEGNAIPGSDIDLDILFKGGLESGREGERAKELARHCGAMAAMELDIVVQGESQEKRWGVPNLKLSSMLVYGEDIRGGIELMAVDRYARLSMPMPVRFFKRVRGNPARLVFPLQFPDPDDEFFGYGRQRGGGDGAYVDTKEIINCVGKAAVALVLYKGRAMVKNKADCLEKYRSVIADEWTDLVESAFGKCRDQWHYRAPESGEEREQLRDICRRTLDFENHFLAIFRDFMAEELVREERGDLWLSPSEVDALGIAGEAWREEIAGGRVRREVQHGEEVAQCRDGVLIYLLQTLADVRFPGDPFAGQLRRLAAEGHGVLAEAARRCLAADES